MFGTVFCQELSTPEIWRCSEKQEVVAHPTLRVVHCGSTQLALDGADCHMGAETRRLVTN